MRPIDERCTDIADRVVPAYRDANARHTGCTSHTAKRWQAAYDGAWYALTEPTTRVQR